MRHDRHPKQLRRNLQQQRLHALTNGFLLNVRHRGGQKIISARDLAKYANVRRSSCSIWLQQHVIPSHLDHHQEELEQRVEKEEESTSTTSHGPRSDPNHSE